MIGSYRFLLITALTVTIGMNLAGKVTAADAPQSTVKPSQKKAQSSPAVIIYSLSTCPHCAEAKDYLTKKGIPFINREVDTDDEHMAELMKMYDEMNVPDERRGVPFFIIGAKTRLQGFDQEKFEAALREAARK